MRVPPLVAGVALAAASTPLCAVTVVEYYNAALDHYFMTALASEVDALDAGRFAGWARTGFVFEAAATPVSGVNPVCRFYIPPAHGDSHFFSASPAECDAVIARIGVDPNFSGYVEETPAAFYIALPNTTSGACPSGTSPVYRLWNGRADSNHRYTTDRATRDAMVARGYVPEGYGADAVAMCTTHAGVGDSQVTLTSASPYPPGCDNVALSGTVYPGAEVEPYVAADPQNPSHLIGVWQQDRWSDGGARGLRTGYSFDGGLTWSPSQAAFTPCSGDVGAGGRIYERASDPWVAIGPDGIAYQIAIAFTGDTFVPGSASAVLASRSLDGGRTWSTPAALIRDGSTAFNDKESIAADPLAPGIAYASWDRLDQPGHGPSFFARTLDGGATWEPARPIYDPGGRDQTLNNQVVPFASGSGGDVMLANFFTEFDVGQNGVAAAHLALLRSADRGITWGAPTFVADIRSVGAYDPQNPARPLRDATNLGAFAAGPGGRLVAVWQDARFAGGQRDGIVFAQSADGGATWSAPVQINAVRGVQAFLPAVAVRSDGTIGVLYYDMRNDTADPATIMVDVWLTTSRDGATWSERHVAGPFDFNTAPIAEGSLFVGDYQGLAAAGDAFAALFARTNASAANRTDVVASVFRGIAPATAAKYAARGAPVATMTPQWQARIDASVQRTLRARLRTAPPPAAR